MKKAILITAIISTGVLAENLSGLMPPPMPPGMISPMMTQKAVKDSNKSSEQKNNLSKKIEEDPCALIPPMLYRLPTPLLNMVDKCQTKLLKPNKKEIKERLIKNGFAKNIEIIKIEPLKDSNRLYKINIKNDKTLICDEKIKICFDKKPLIFN